MNAYPENTRGSISSRRLIAGVTTLALAWLVAPALARAQNAYITNEGEDEASNTVSVIDTATNQVVGSPITVGAHPFAFGQFIQPLILAGKPGSPNCHGKSVSALAQKFGGLAHAADTLGFASVSALQDTINRFCGG